LAQVALGFTFVLFVRTGLKRRFTSLRSAVKRKTLCVKARGLQLSPINLTQPFIENINTKSSV